MKAPCPLCGCLIDPSDFDWVCDKCGHENKHGNIYTSCEKCKAGFDEIKCPHCHKKIDMMLLLGSYK
jgi:hypothetical protein